MAKATKEVAEKAAEGKVKNVDNGLDRAVEAIQTLKVQLIEHQKQAEHHQTMAVKAQGALEVLLQLYPEEKETNNK